MLHRVNVGGTLKICYKAKSATSLLARMSHNLKQWHVKLHILWHIWHWTLGLEPKVGCLLRWKFLDKVVDF